jgi:hypothetical protein
MYGIILLEYSVTTLCSEGGSPGPVAEGDGCLPYTDAAGPPAQLARIITVWVSTLPKI